MVSFVADAYSLIGDLHKTTGGTKLPHAISAYTLALKHDPDRQDVRASLSWCMAETNQRHRGGESSGATAHPSSSSADIENILSSHTVLASSDALNVACTMCGECCRHADYIFLSPVDLWRLLRAPAMVSRRKSWKDAMRIEANGKRSKSQWETVLIHLNRALHGAFNWSSKDGLPLCYLSPKRAAEVDAILHFLSLSTTGA